MPLLRAYMHDPVPVMTELYKLIFYEQLNKKFSREGIFSIINDFFNGNNI